MPEENDPNANEPDHIKNLRKKAEDHDKVAGERDTMARELAFTKAGFDTDHPLVANLMTTYTGELTKDAVTAHMDGLKVTELVRPTAPPASGAGEAAGGAPAGGEAGGEAPPTGGDTQTGTRLGTVESGEAPGGLPTADPRVDGLNKAFDLMEQGATREAAATAFFGSIFTAAAAGDSRVIVAERKGGE